MLTASFARAHTGGTSHSSPRGDLARGSEGRESTRRVATPPCASTLASSDGRLEISPQSPSTSCMRVEAGRPPASQRAARKRAAREIRAVAARDASSSMRSPGPANVSRCSPTTSPPRSTRKPIAPRGRGPRVTLPRVDRRVASFVPRAAATASPSASAVPRGRIDLVAMVRFEDLDVVARVERSRRKLDEAEQQVHADAHVRRQHDRRSSLATAVELAHAGLVVPGRADHERATLRRARRRAIGSATLRQREVDRDLGAVERRAGSSVITTAPNGAPPTSPASRPIVAAPGRRQRAPVRTRSVARFDQRQRCARPMRPVTPNSATCSSRISHSLSPSRRSASRRRATNARAG